MPRDTRLYMIARIVPKADQFDETRNMIAEVIEPTLAESGVDRFRLHEGEDDGTRVLYLYETFRDQAALDFHIAQDFVRPVFARYRDLLAEPIKVVKLAHVAG